MTGAPAPSGRTKGSCFFPFIWKRLPRTLPISEIEKIKTIWNSNSKLNNSREKKEKVYSLGEMCSARDIRHTQWGHSQFEILYQFSFNSRFSQYTQCFSLFGILFPKLFWPLHWEKIVVDDCWLRKPLQFKDRELKQFIQTVKFLKHNAF